MKTVDCFLFEVMDVPFKPCRPCRHNWCAKLAVRGEMFCEDHLAADKTEMTYERNRAYDDTRKNASQRGYDAEWRKIRMAFLKQNPLCVMCMEEGKTTPATVVDHIIPHRGDKRLFYDVENYQALCKRHHDLKTRSGQ